MAEQRPVGREKEGGAVQRVPGPLDHPNHDMHRMRGDGDPEPVEILPRNVHRRPAVPREQGPPRIGPRPDSGPEGRPLGIPPDERLGEHHQLGATACRPGEQRLEPTHRLNRVEQTGRGLHNRHTTTPHARER